MFLIGYSPCRTCVICALTFLSHPQIWQPLIKHQVMTHKHHLLFVLKTKAIGIFLNHTIELLFSYHRKDAIQADNVREHADRKSNDANARIRVVSSEE